LITESSRSFSVRLVIPEAAQRLSGTHEHQIASKVAVHDQPRSGPATRANDRAVALGERAWAAASERAYQGGREEMPTMLYDAEALDARAAIADLVHTYALNIRMREGEACADLFTEDAVFETRRADPDARMLNRLEGRASIAAYLAKASHGETRVCPMIHNLLITVDGREASSNCLMAALALPGGTELIGEYRDTYRFDGVWRFSSRTYTILHERAGPQP
jgi:hypothetical protein